ncbi:MAG TPA: TasA family protein [Dermatophilaceae bacterium]|jgi:spore coat-associated protein N
MNSSTATKSGRRTNTGKILTSLGVVGAAAAVAGLGTFGSFASTTSGTQAVAAGTVVIALGSGTGNPIGVPASNVVPGDTIQRAFTLANTGTSDLAAVTLTTTAVPSSLLDTDATNGLQLKIESCGVAWVAAGTTSAPTYTCSGTTGVALLSKAVIGANTPITTAAVTHGTTSYLKVTLSLPTTAGDTFQGASSLLNFSFTGVQRAAASL